MDEYQHLRDSADEATAIELFEADGQLVHAIRHMQGIPPRDYRDEDRAQQARREASLIRERAAYKQRLRDRARIQVLRSMRGDF